MAICAIDGEIIWDGYRLRYDGRRDVYASTKGAMKFLAYLNKRFNGDWLHALAAYNSGEGRVRQAIKRNKLAGKPTDWHLDLPKETRIRS